MQKLCYLVLVVCIACSTQEENAVVTVSHSQQNKAQEVDSSHSQNRLIDTLPSEAPDSFLTPEKFKAAKLDTFRIGQVDNLVKLTPSEERQYLQQPIVHSIYKPYHFYSLQENTSARKEITLLYDDGEYKLDLLRLVYNKQNKLVSKQVVAFAASDGDVSDDAYGWFETPALFHLVEVRKETMRETQDTAEYALDSIATRFRVSNEQFSQMQRRKFQRHIVEAQVQK